MQSLKIGKNAHRKRKVEEKDTPTQKLQELGIEVKNSWMLSAKGYSPDTPPKTDNGFPIYKCNKDTPQTGDELIALPYAESFIHFSSNLPISIP